MVESEQVIVKKKSVFSETEALTSAISILNKIESGKFPLLLSRIISRYHSPEYTNYFSPNEIIKLETSLGIDRIQVQLVIDTIKFVIDKASYSALKPATLANELMEIGLEEERAGVCAQAWGNNGKSVIERLKKEPFCPSQLEDVHWRLNLQLAQTDLTRQKIPNAIFEFQISDSSTVPGGGSSERNVTTEFTKDELYSFFNELEKIQAQLDQLT